MSIQSIAREIVEQYASERRGTPIAFIRAYRRFAKIPALSTGQAFNLAQETFPKEYKAYCRAKALGKTLPSLDDPKNSLEQRRAAAIRRGGCIN